MLPLIKIDSATIWSHTWIAPSLFEIVIFYLLFKYNSLQVVNPEISSNLTTSLIIISASEKALVAFKEFRGKCDFPIQRLPVNLCSNAMKRFLKFLLSCLQCIRLKERTNLGWLWRGGNRRVLWDPAVIYQQKEAAWHRETIPSGFTNINNNQIKYFLTRKLVSTLLQMSYYVNI